MSHLPFCLQIRQGRPSTLIRLMSLYVSLCLLMSLQWVLRRSNGYFVDSSLGAFASGPQGGTLALFDNAQQFDPFIFTVGKAIHNKHICTVGKSQPRPSHTLKDAHLERLTPRKSHSEVSQRSSHDPFPNSVSHRFVSHPPLEPQLSNFPLKCPALTPHSPIRVRPIRNRFQFFFLVTRRGKRSQVSTRRFGGCVRVGCDG